MKLYNDQILKEKIYQCYKKLHLESVLFSYSSFDKKNVTLFYEEEYIVILESICTSISLNNEYPDFFIRNLYDFLSDYRYFCKEKLDHFSFEVQRINKMIRSINVPSRFVSNVEHFFFYFREIFPIEKARFFSSHFDKQVLVEKFHQYIYVFMEYLLGEVDFSSAKEYVFSDKDLHVLKILMKRYSFLFYDYDILSRTFEILFEQWKGISNFEVNDFVTKELNSLYEDLQKIYKKKKY